MENKRKDEWQHECETADPILYEALKEFASINRKNQTVAEKRLWKILSNNRYNFKFRRQHIIGGFIVDFVNLKYHLIIEVDGGYHFELSQQVYDENRTKALKTMGYAVIRFTNEQILEDCISIAEQIYDKIFNIEENQ